MSVMPALFTRIHSKVHADADWIRLDVRGGNRTPGSAQDTGLMGPWICQMFCMKVVYWM